MDRTDARLTRELLAQFFLLCAVPRPSGGEAQAAAHIAGQLRQAGLEPEIDSAYNLRCLLPPTPGCGRAPGVILQAHTDMVCVAAPGGGYRPGLDPVTPVTDTAFLRSDGRSSLGADNGMAVALMLWLAEQRDLPHGPVLLLFTSCEERGLVGAKAVDPRWLEGFEYYINLDAFRGDAAIFASAGGLRQSWSRGIERAKNEKPFAFTITLSGLTGGHSGFDIHRGRLNALTALGAFLSGTPCALAAFSGGSDFNAIPTRAQAQAAVEDPDAFRHTAAQWEQQLKTRHGSTDPGLTVTLEETPAPAQVWTGGTTRDVLGFLSALPCGPSAMRQDCPGTVADSGNPAILKREGDRLTLSHFARCATRESLNEVRSRSAKYAKDFRFTQFVSSSYAPWAGTAQSPLAQRVKQIYRALFGTELELTALHVGLESSLLLEKAPHLTGIALGCDILDAHSVSERVRLDSIPRMARLVIAILNELGKEEC